MKSVLVIGSACVDVIIRVDHLPRTEENLRPQSQRFAIGGCAYNCANILKRGGAPLVFITPVGGQGVFGGFVRSALDQLEYKEYIDLPDAQNGCCYCFVEKSGERTFLSVHGVEYTFDPAWMEPYAQKHFDYGYVCGLEIEESTGEKLVSYLEAADIGTLFYAPGPRGCRVLPSLTERLLALHPVLHLNELEAVQLSGADDLKSAMDALYCKTCRTVIVTQGPKGVRWLDETGHHSLPGQPVSQVADTIGAGDSHVGAVLLGLSRGYPMYEALKMANRVAAAVVCTDGATLSDSDLWAAISE